MYELSRTEVYVARGPFEEVYLKQQMVGDVHQHKHVVILLIFNIERYVFYSFQDDLAAICQNPIT